MGNASSSGLPRRAACFSAGKRGSPLVTNSSTSLDGFRRKGRAKTVSRPTHRRALVRNDSVSYSANHNGGASRTRSSRRELRRRQGKRSPDHGVGSDWISPVFDLPFLRRGSGAQLDANISPLSPGANSGKKSRGDPNDSALPSPTCNLRRS